jgi:transposase
MDNAPIHKNKNIQLYVEGRGYGCIYLPPYSPELNPIEQFWSIVKSKLKREALLEEETLSSRVSDACNKVLISDLQGFCRYSYSRSEDFRTKTFIINSLFTFFFWSLSSFHFCTISILKFAPNQFLLAHQ